MGESAAAGVRAAELAAEPVDFTRGSGGSAGRVPDLESLAL